MDKLFNISTTAESAFNRACKRARKEYEHLCKKKKQIPNPHHLINLRFHDLRHEATSRLAEVYETHELAKITGHKDTRMLLRYYHPDAHKLSQKFAQSIYGKEQIKLIQNLMAEDTYTGSAGNSTSNG